MIIQSKKFDYFFKYIIVDNKILGFEFRCDDDAFDTRVTFSFDNDGAVNAVTVVNEKGYHVIPNIIDVVV